MSILNKRSEINGKSTKHDKYQLVDDVLINFFKKTFIYKTLWELTSYMFINKNMVK